MDNSMGRGQVARSRARAWPYAALGACLFAASLPASSAFGKDAVEDSIQEARELAAKEGASASGELKRRLAREPEGRVRAGLVAALAAVLPREDVAGALEPSLADKDPLARAEVVAALGRAGGEPFSASAVPTGGGPVGAGGEPFSASAVPTGGGPVGAGGEPVARALEKVLLEDDNAGVRLAAAFWLGGLKDPASAEALGNALSRDKDPNVRAQAARSLRWLATPAAKAALKKGGKDADKRVRRIADGK